MRRRVSIINSRPSSVVRALRGMGWTVSKRGLLTSSLLEALEINCCSISVNLNKKKAGIHFYDGDSSTHEIDFVHNSTVLNLKDKQ